MKTIKIHPKRSFQLGAIQETSFFGDRFRAKPWRVGITFVFLLPVRSLCQMKVKGRRGCGNRSRKISLKIFLVSESSSLCLKVFFQPDVCPLCLMLCYTVGVQRLFRHSPSSCVAHSLGVGQRHTYKQWDKYNEISTLQDGWSWFCGTYKKNWLTLVEGQWEGHGCRGRLHRG